MQPATTLETPRLVLRPHTADDFEDSLAMWSDPQVTRYIGGKPFSREEVWARLLRYVGHWALLGFGYWAVREKTTGRFVGEAGFADFQREIEPPFDGTPEIGWALAAWAHGQGYATETVRAALAWADEKWPNTQTVCMISPANAASIRVASKCGYRESGSVLYKERPVTVYRRTPGTR
ncbi:MULTISPECIES: GNAT family N-acetyltransferase [Paraburkholderia]|jgi:RimJ/RimL family protein N-acetyltransferase|uniref:GNAT family N-acetyltransferase n=1 Tax=Paraburkholderia TaxID=1822464 RepID=UPI0003459826|nr:MULTISPECIES: GNAT family N-acetyltransferase [Paraburkholderia]WEY40819.1 GNAT family N-acetyltransferase [Paraburkholderia sp. SUR17]